MFSSFLFSSLCTMNISSNAFVLFALFWIITKYFFVFLIVICFRYIFRVHFLLSFINYPGQIAYKQEDIAYSLFFFNWFLRYHQWEKLTEYPKKEVVVKQETKF